MRLKAGIWVGAYLRKLNALAVTAVVARRGDGDAGAIFVKVASLDGFALVLRPAATGLAGTEDERFWSLAFPEGRLEETKADAYLTRQAGFDPDIWVIEVEDRQGRHFLDDHLIKE